MDGSHHRDLLNALEPAPSDQQVARQREAEKASHAKPKPLNGPDGKLLALWQTIQTEARALDTGEGIRNERERQEASARLREKELKLARLMPRTANGVLAKIAFAKHLGGIGGEHLYAARNLRTIEAALGRMAEGEGVRSVRSTYPCESESDPEFTAETIGDANTFLKRVDHLGVCARSAWGMLQMSRGEIRERYGNDRKMLDYTSNLFVDGSKLAEQLSGIIETANLRLLSGAAPDTVARPSEADRRFLAEAESLFRKYVPAEQFDPNACAAWCSNALAVAKQDRAQQKRQH
jgi:hypothetical protein